MCFHYWTKFSLLMASSDSEITMQEKVFLASAAITYDSATRAIKQYEERYHRKAPGRTTVQYWKDQLWTEGSLLPRKKSGRPSDENVRNQVISYVLENSEDTSQRQIAANVGTSSSTVNRVLRDEKIRPWKYQLVHEITEEDFDKRLQFAEWILTRSNPLEFAKTIVFSDECSFHLNGNLNRHNMFYYSKENEHPTIVRPLKSEAITAWAAVSYHHGLTYVIMDQTVNSERYVQILSTKVMDYYIYLDWTLTFEVYHSRPKSKFYDFKKLKLFIKTLTIGMTYFVIHLFLNHRKAFSLYLEPVYCTHSNLT